MKKVNCYADLQRQEWCCAAKGKTVLLKNKIARFFIDLVSTDKTEMPPYTGNGIGRRFFADSVKGGCYGRAW